MTDELNYFKRLVMDPISPTFCASKWYDAVIFLNEGRTKSCHHTPDHPISQRAIEVDVRALHNTDQKKDQRELMLAGERPRACRYCWNVEDCAEEGTYPDRVPYTRRYTEDDIQRAAQESSDWNAPLRTLEVSFDRTCNFACSYCSPRFSTTWAKDIRNNGRYVLREQASYYGHDGSELAEPYGRNNTGNPYIAAFMEWWPELSQTLEQIRITGGEPIMSAWFWKWAELVKEAGVNDNLLVSVNSNLGAKESIIDDLIAFTHTVPRFSLFTSCEAYGEHAEYLRDGLDYYQWRTNLGYMMARGNTEQTTIMTTITALSVYSFPNFLNDILHMREEEFAEPDANILISFNMLKSPTFMSVLVLPQEMRDERADHFEDWLAHNGHRLSDWEQNGMRKVIGYLRTGQDPLWTDDPQTRMSNELDFYLFYLQYDERRDKSFRDTFEEDAPELTEWYDELAEIYAEDIAKYHEFRDSGRTMTGPKRLPVGEDV